MFPSVCIFIFQKFPYSKITNSISHGEEISLSLSDISSQIFGATGALRNFLLSPRWIPASKIVKRLLNFEIPMVYKTGNTASPLL